MAAVADPPPTSPVTAIAEMPRAAPGEVADLSACAARTGLSQKVSLAYEGQQYSVVLTSLFNPLGSICPMQKDELYLENGGGGRSLKKLSGGGTDSIAVFLLCSFSSQWGLGPAGV